MIKRFRLQNFQSYGEETPMIELSADKTNIFDAPNETGKSVLGKVLKYIAFPRSGNFRVNDLITEKKDKAIFYAETDKDDQSVGIVVTRDMISYVIFNKDKEKTNVWSYRLSDTKACMPPEVAALLGLILDYTGQVVINVLEKTEQLFITTGPEVNARALAPVLEDAKVENVRAEVTTTLARVKAAKNMSNREFKNANARLQNTPYRDPTEIQTKVTKIDQLLNLVQINRAQLKTLISDYTLSIVDGLDLREVKEDTNIDELMKLCSSIHHIRETFDSFVEIQEREIDDVDKDCNTVFNIISGLDIVLENLRKELEVPSRIVDRTKIIDSFLEMLNSLDLVSKELLKLSELKKPKTVKDRTNLIEPFFALSDLGLRKYFDELFELQKKIEKLTELEAQLSIEFEKFKEEVGECPLCGQPLKKGEDCCGT